MPGGVPFPVVLYGIGFLLGMLGMSLELRYRWHLVLLEVLALVVLGPVGMGIGRVGPPHS